MGETGSRDSAASAEGQEAQDTQAAVALPLERLLPKQGRASAFPAINALDLRQFFSARFSGGGGQPPTQARVVIIDDDRSLLSLLRVIFQEANFNVTSFLNGTEALDYLTEHSADVIILDLEMPMMSGRQFYRAIRDAGISTPVLLLSAYGARAARDELGAEAFADKPFDPEVLVETIQDLLSRG